VVLFHTHAYLILIGGNPDTYFRFFDVRFSYGAWFFFVLSGFPMAYLIDTGYERFLIQRLVRIYPPYWG
jgi:exopolysaccharide production protein ExoZ